LSTFPFHILYEEEKEKVFIRTQKYENTGINIASRLPEKVNILKRAGHLCKENENQISYYKLTYQHIET